MIRVPPEGLQMHRGSFRNPLRRYEDLSLKKTLLSVHCLKKLDSSPSRRLPSGGQSTLLSSHSEEETWISGIGAE